MFMDSDVEITNIESIQSKPLERKRPFQFSSWVMSSFEDFDCPPKLTKTTSMDAKEPHVSSVRKLKVSDTTDVLFNQYQPNKRTELCVHVRKVAEVESWLKKVLKAPSRTPRILLLTGPSGCGKSATLRCLCSQQDINLREWCNPLGSDELEKLEQFLFRSDRYNNNGIVKDADDCHQDSKSGDTVILLEDLPSCVTDHPELLRKLLLRHATMGQVPLVLIMSDSSTRSLSPHWLLPKTTLNELHIDTIRFNPVAPTQMKKALQRIADFEGRRRRGSVRAVTGTALAELITECGGDIRSAVNRMQFLLTLPSSHSKSSNATEIEKNDSNNSRDNAPSLFRSLGKILHTKRLASGEVVVDPPDTLPSHLTHHQRQPLSFSPEEVFESSRLPGTLFSAFLHENCTDFFADICELGDALDTFSLADCIGAVWCPERPPGAQLADLYVGPLAARGLAFAKQQSRSVGFRPLRRPQMLSLPKTYQGKENLADLLDLGPYRRVLRNRGQQCRLSWSIRNGGTLTEHDSAFEGSGRPRVSLRDVDVKEEENDKWTFVTTLEDESVTIDDVDT